MNYDMNIISSKLKKYKILETNEIIDFDYLKKVVGLEQERLKKISEISELVEFFFRDKLDYPIEFLRWKKMTNEEIIKNLFLIEKELIKIKEDDFNKENLEKILMELTKKTGTGELLWPLRVSLSGRKCSPSPFEIAEVLGKEKVLKRIKQAVEIMKNKLGILNFES